MPTYMSVKRIMKPKNKIPKYSILRSTSFHIFKGDDGKLKMTKTVTKKFRVNKV